MKYSINKARQRINKKPALLTVAILVGLVLVVGTFEKLHIIDLYSSKRPSVSELPEAKTTSTAPSAQENFTDGGDRQASSTNGSEGTVSDNNGSVGTIPSTNDWTLSSDGSITVYSPAKSALVTSGSTLSGSSTHQKVQFRLIDDVSGVIAQGSVKVVNGKYSGTFSFSSTGTVGRLDVFYANEDGVESSSISIPVRYK